MQNKGYQSFADFYDDLMEADYKAISDRIDELVISCGVKRGILLDVGCGTGTLCELMARKGYDVIGVDTSEQMLSRAMDKRFESGLPIQYLRQDMTRLDMFGTIDVTVCTLDSLNHLNNFDEVKKTFAGVSLFAEPQGLFIFDVNTVYKHNCVLGNNTFVYETDNVFCVWQNFIDKENCVEINLDIFENVDGSYRRYSEEFSETAYSLEDIRAALAENNFAIVGEYDGYTKNLPCEKSERVLFCCRKV